MCKNTFTFSCNGNIFHRNCAILVEGNEESSSYFLFEPVVQMMFLGFSILSSGGHFVQQIGIICTILVEAIMGNCNS